MSKPFIEVQVRAVAAASGGVAVFLGNEEKVLALGWRSRCLCKARNGSDR